MLNSGMIFQFNTNEGDGLIMSSTGETKTFSVNEWTDTSNEPSIGLKVSFEDGDAISNIQVLNENSIGENKAKDDEVSFTSLQEYQTYFLDKGFEVIKNRQESVDDKLEMGKFSGDTVEGVSISFKDDNAHVSKTSTKLKSVDEYINYFNGLGYKLAKDLVDGTLRIASLRRFSENGHGEMIITEDDSIITVKTMVNGKEVD